jgi:hypothetical protein
LKALAIASVKCVPPGLGDRLGEVRAAQREGAYPAAPSLGDDDVGGVRADVEVDHGPLALAQLMVVDHGVVDGHRAQVEGGRGDAQLGEQAQTLLHALAGDGEDADLDLGGVIGGEGLVVPLDLVDGEGNLLYRLELDDVGDLLGLDGRELREARKRRVARDGDDQVLALQRVLADELPEAEPGQLVLVDVGCGEHLLVGNDGEVGHPHAVALALQANRLDGGGADLHSPGCLGICHSVTPSRGTRGM